VCTSADRFIRVWDIKTGHCLLVCSGHKAKVTDITLNETCLYSAAEDGIIKKWDFHPKQRDSAFNAIL